MNKTTAPASRFSGFTSPHYTQVPDELFDTLMVELSGVELKVLLYIIRRTFGFKRDSDTISLSQMLNGLKSRDGRQLDHGVGISKRSLLAALRTLAERGVILIHHTRNRTERDRFFESSKGCAHSSKRCDQDTPAGSATTHHNSTQVQHRHRPGAVHQRQSRRPWADCSGTSDRPSRRLGRRWPPTSPSSPLSWATGPR